MNKIDGKRIFLKLERITENELKLEFDFPRDDDKYVYIMGIASTPDENSAGFVVENKALIKSWEERKKANKNVAVYEKHNVPIGKVVNCEEMGGKVLVVLEIPKDGNERFLSVYEQGVYIGLSIGAWNLEYDVEDDIVHVKEVDWYEVSVTDIPANENALLLENIKEQQEAYKKALEQAKRKTCMSVDDITKFGNDILEKIRGI